MKQNCLIKTFLGALILITQVSLYLFFSFKTYLKLHNISVSPTLVEKIKRNLDLSKVSDPDHIRVVVLKNCEPKLSYRLAELINMWLKEFNFLDFWKVSLMVPTFKNVGERYTARNYHPLNLLSLVSNVFENLVKNRFVVHLEKEVLCFGFWYDFRSLDQIFWQLYLIELLRLLIGLGLP